MLRIDILGDASAPGEAERPSLQALAETMEATPELVPAARTT
jgi:hypothetical protein